MIKQGLMIELDVSRIGFDEEVELAHDVAEDAKKRGIEYPEGLLRAYQRSARTGKLQPKDLPGYIAPKQEKKGDLEWLG